MEQNAKSIIAMTPAADHSAKEGYFVVVSSGEAALCTSATTLPFGVITDGEATTGADSIAVVGGNAGPCDVKLGGAVSKGDYLELQADGTVIEDSGSGARLLVGIALEDGVATELVPAVLITPIVYAS